jgi:hypothetical protein
MPENSKVKSQNSKVKNWLVAFIPPSAGQRKAKTQRKTLFAPFVFFLCPADGGMKATSQFLTFDF